MKIIQVPVIYLKATNQKLGAALFIYAFVLAYYFRACSNQFFFFYLKIKPSHFTSFLFFIFLWIYLLKNKYINLYRNF